MDGPPKQVERLRQADAPLNLDGLRRTVLDSGVHENHRGVLFRLFQFDGDKAEGVLLVRDELAGLQLLLTLDALPPTEAFVDLVDDEVLNDLLRADLAAEHLDNLSPVPTMRGVGPLDREHELLDLLEKEGLIPNLDEISV